jgi:Flp pilus assembly pilin Flp
LPIYKEAVTKKEEERFRMINMLKDLHKEESGQDLIEYALIAALIAVASIAAMGILAARSVTSSAKSAIS